VESPGFTSRAVLHALGDAGLLLIVQQFLGGEPVLGGAEDRVVEF